VHTKKALQVKILKSQLYTNFTQYRANFENFYTKLALLVQPVREKIILEMVVGREIGILNGQSSCFFSKEPFEKNLFTRNFPKNLVEKRPVMTIQDSDFFSNYRFESRVFGNGL